MIVRSYADLVRIARRMGPVLLVLGLLYIIAAMAWFIASAIVPTWIGRFTTRMLLFIGISGVAAPFYVALHRFIAYDEVRWLPRLELYSGESRVYAAYAALSMALYFSPFLLREVLTAFGLEGLGWLCFFCGIIAVWTLLVRLTTLLPMAALAPERASWKRAMEQSETRAGSFFFQSTVPALPAMIALGYLGAAAARHAIEPVPFFVLSIAALLMLQLLPLSVATRLYLRIDKGSVDDIRRKGRVLPNGLR